MGGGVGTALGRTGGEGTALTTPIPVPTLIPPIVVPTFIPVATVGMTVGTVGMGWWPAASAALCIARVMGLGSGGREGGLAGEDVTDAKSMSI